MAGKQELALCYAPEAGPKVRKRKGVLARLGIRVRNVRPEQAGELIGTLAGLEGYRKAEKAGKEGCQSNAENDRGAGSAETTVCQSLAKGSGAGGRPEESSDRLRQTEDRRAPGIGTAGSAPQIPEEMLVLCNFSGAKLDQLLRELRKANASVALKAVLTETNAGWSFYQLYHELQKERDAIAP